MRARIGRSVRWFVEWCWGCCGARPRPEIDAAFADVHDDDVELPVADQVHDLYTRLLPPESPTASGLDPGLTSVPLDSPPRPKLSFSNMLMHESVIADRLNLKKSGWDGGTAKLDG